MRKIGYTLLSLVLLAACSSKDVSSPDFTVKLRSAALHAGDTAFFDITGAPYNMTFYSGEPGKQYKYRTRTSAEGIPQLQFTSYMQNGTQANTLQLLVSTDFSATYDSASIYKATWTDITSRAKLSTGTNNTASGIVDLSDFVNGKPVYIAFKYTGQQNTSVQRTWTIPTFTIANILKEDGSSQPVISALADAVFTAVNMKGTAVKWNISTTQMQIAGGVANSPATENWAVSKGLMLNRVVPDPGTSIKKITDNGISAYFYVYKTAGSYTATFVAANTTVYDSKTDVKEIPVTVNP
ncbi:MAG: DUF5017 domain-containing protein [Filimonas sp.]|nr:DUF5017 domain-containing protein [Filimonas sp.]